METGYPDPLYLDSGKFPGSDPTLLSWFQWYLEGQKSWQAQNDAKHSLTPDMICDIAFTTHLIHQDSDPAMIYDWLVLGLSTGARWVEYAQTNRTKIEMVWVQLDQHKPQLEQPYAFIAGDFTFFDENRSPLKGRSQAKAAFVRIRQHGEVVLHQMSLPEGDNI